MTDQAAPPAPPSGGGGGGGERRRRRRRRGRGGGGGGGERAQGGAPPAGAPEEGDEGGEGDEDAAPATGAQPSGGQPQRPPQPQPQRPQGSRPDGNRPRGDRPPQGQQTRAEQPSQASRGARSDSDKSMRGPKPPHGERGRGERDRDRGRGGRGERGRDRDRDRGPQRRDDRPREARGERPPRRDEGPAPTRTEPTAPPLAGATPLVRPPEEIDAGWGLPDESAPHRVIDAGSGPAAQAAEPEKVRTPTPPLAPEPRDPDGDDLFIDLTDEAVPPGTLTNVTGVKFREAGTIHAYDAGEAVYRRGDRVIVESDRGPLLATVAVGTRRQPALDPLRRIVRPATAADDKAREKNLSREREAYLFCKQRIRERGLRMKLTRVELPLQGQGKVLFYFASEERIDFRDLVKDLAQRFHARIEMRQIGARDEAKMVGGIGSCGRELCCSTWLPAFVPISIKMAKDQGLPLNPSKVSGQCGRLKCCLVYEQDTYKEMRKTLPKVGKRVSTPGGDGKVVELDVLRQRVRVWFDEGGSETFPADVVRLLAPPGGPPTRGGGAEGPVSGPQGAPPRGEPDADAGE